MTTHKVTPVKKLKVMTVVGTRPEIIRLSRVIARLDAEPAMEHILVHTGQNYDYELNEIFFKDLELRAPDVFLKAAGATAAETIGQIIARMDPVLAEHRPDALLILGDTNSSLSAIPAKRRKIPVFHMEAGNRCFDERVPEEINRRIVDHIADINLPYSSIAREYLLREGIAPDRIIKTGSPMYEVLHHYMKKINASKVLKQLHLRPKHCFLVSVHREENVDDSRHFGQFVEVLNGLVKEYGERVIVSTHPRTRKRLEEEKTLLPAGVEFLKPFAFTDYVKLQMNARVVLSDSGTITEESSILDIPALNCREAHERPEGMEEAAVILTGLRWDRVKEGILMLAAEGRGKKRRTRIVRDYDVPDVSHKVVRLILSYTDYVNNRVWKKQKMGN
jgi:UDP-N-acetylglucosamine 2-epimerase (non-hydrolysing)